MSRTPRAFIGCEFSGAVRRELRAVGVEAFSCDLLPAEDGSPFHLVGDALSYLNGSQGAQWAAETWDLLIAHPPCTHLAVSGARWFPAKRADGSQQAAIAFFMALANQPIPRIAVENPVCIMSRLYRKPDQIVQPHWFGHAETKATCLWLKGLPLLTPTNKVEPDFMRKADGTYYTDAKGKRYSRIHFMSGHHGKGCKRQQERSRTYAGVAAAFASQWGKLL